MAPVVDIVEIGNGGGSIAWIDEAGSLKVGPQSAGICRDLWPMERVERSRRRRMPAC